MSMQISQMMRSLLGELQPAEAKTVELKAGQVVKGMVLQLLGEQDAIVNIGGVHLRAKLETSLQQGQVAHFQVQPESTGSLTILKAVDVAAAFLGEDSIANMLQSFGMKDSPSLRQLAKQLQQAEIPLTKAVLQNFAAIAEQAPAGVPSEQWLEAAIVASKRNLPVTRESVQSLREAMFGQPLGEKLNGLQQLARQTLQTMALPPGPAADEAQQLLTKLEQAIEAVRGQTEQAVKAGNGQQVVAGENDQAAKGTIFDKTPAERPVDAGSVSGKQAAASPTEGSKASVLATRAADGAAMQTAPAAEESGDTQPQAAVRSDRAAPGQERPAAEQAGANAASRTSEQAEERSAPSGFRPEAGGGRGEAERTVGNVGRQEGQVPLGKAAPEAGGSPLQATGQADKAAETNEPADAQRQPPKQAEPQEHTAAPRMQAKGEDNWISRLFKAVGMDNEHQLSRAIMRAEHRAHPTAGPESASMLLAAGAAVPEQPVSPSDVLRHAAADSLKSVLLQISGSDAMPSTLRESAQQALQQITGQQLLLSPDRGAALTHLTLMLPVRQDGVEQTAAVHVQTRKGSRGELDASNCRLLFDLNMQTLGLTLVDVQVYDRKVHLQVHNDMPVLAGLLEAYREEIEEGLRQNGYECAVLKCSPYPQSLSSAGRGEAAGGAELPVQSPSAAAYRVKSYKGVDMRV
ncbi:hypothetical protein [Paenibacillus ginsengarvi]|uniref:Flagellar hook-length control protein FliK n=1 Tax=Paenibacillus ginsengarvi TaxID=400777 RepID=A0A3B0CTY1_9BACL|nr:hypothetical protein [Paenibacillus ginsengarvi]RKN86539.1 hypothetical protein D7M11_00790 [Paenibacillus ginsengarvi]